MLRRLVVAGAILLVSLALLMLPMLIAVYRGITRDGASGIGFVVGSLTENIVRIAVLLVLAIFSYWLSGKLLKA
jgi:hypothetical protein